MPIQQVTLQEALEKGYEILGPVEAGRTAPPTILENAELIAKEVAPAILGGIVGSFGGPGGTLAGGAAGSAAGNLWAQQTRIEMGLSDDIGEGELLAATAAGLVPFGKLAKAGFKTKVALRGMQGAGIATGETVARTLIDEQRAPTEDEIKMSLLFGFGIGGGMGAVEAKYFNKAIEPEVGEGVEVAKKGMTRYELIESISNNKQVGIDEAEDLLRQVEEGGYQGMIRWTSDNPQGDLARLNKFAQLDKLGGDDQLNQILDFEFATPQEKARDPVKYLSFENELDDVQRSIKAIQRVKQGGDKFTPDMQNYLARLLEREAQLKQTPTTIQEPTVFAPQQQPQVGELARLGQVLRSEEAGGAAGVARRKEIEQAAQQQIKRSYQMDEVAPVQPTIFAPQQPPAPKPAPIIPAQVNANIIADLKASMTDLGTETVLDTNKLNDIQQQISAFTKQTSLKKPQKKRLKALQKQEQYMLEQIPQDQLPLGYTEQYRRIRTLEDKLDNIEAQLPNAPKNERGMLAKERRELRKALNEERNYLTKEEAQAKGLLSNRKFQEYLMSGGLTSGAGLAYLMSDEDGEFKTASVTELLGVGLMVALGLGLKQKFLPRRPKVIKTPKGPKIKETPIEFHESNVQRVISDQIEHAPPTRMQNMWASAKELAAHVVEPMSRTLKNINPQLASIFRGFENDLSVYRKQIKDRALPFWNELYKKVGKNNTEVLRQLKRAYLNSDTQEIERIAKKYGVDFSKHGTYAKTMRDIRTRAVERAGMEMGEISGYNPRKLKDRSYENFRKALQDNGRASDLNKIDKAIEEYAKKHGMDIDSVSDWEKASITSKILTHDVDLPLGGKGDFTKPRAIQEVEDWMLEFYEDPLTAINRYADNVAFKINAREFLGKQLKFAPADGKSLSQKLEGFTGDDLGAQVSISDTLAGKVATALGKDMDLSDAQIAKVQKIIQARFSGEGGNEFLEGIRNLNYFGTIGNFGTTITQLMDLVNVGWFAGWDNATQALLRKNRRDFFDELGWDTQQGIDWANTSGGLNKALDKVLTVTGFNKLDKWAKNTALNATYIKWKRKVKANKVATETELTERYGASKAKEIADQLDTWDGSIDGKQPTPPEIQFLLFDQTADFIPHNRQEMPVGAGGKFGPIIYQLKTYMLKQLDIYREITGKDLAKANELYAKGDKAGAARLGAKAAGNLALYGGILMAAGASTDTIKDFVYGRPATLDERIEDGIWRLALLNRYHKYQAQRDGIGKMLVSQMLPATTVFDRAGKDIMAFGLGEEVKGHSLQGTILDPIYWHVEGMGGYEKKNK